MAVQPMNSVANSTQTDQTDPLSPQTLIFNYLRSKGIPPNAENIRRAVEANAREGGLGPDPVAGLRNARPSTDAEDFAAGARRGGGSVANKIEDGGAASGGSGLPVPPVPPTDGNASTGESPNTSAAPSSGVDGGAGNELDLSSLILPGLLGVPGAARVLGGGAPQMNAVPGGVPAPTAAPALGGPAQPPLLSGPADQLQLGGPGQSSIPELAMQRALSAPGSTDLTNVNPYQPTAPGVLPPDQSMVSNMPVGQSTADPAVLNEANIRGGARPAPTVPFAPRAGGVPRVAPPATDIMGLIKGLMRVH